MKLKLFLLVIFSTLCLVIIIAPSSAQPNKASPARSIFPVTVNPLACKENEIFYNMTTHQFLVCTGVNTLSSVSFGGSSGGTLSSLNGLTGSIQTFTTGTSGTSFNISSIGTVHTFNIPTASGINRGLLSSSDWLIFNNKQPALGFTAENLANKNSTNGYAGLSSGKITLSQMSEVLAITDLSDYVTISGTGTTAIKATFTGLATNDCLLWDGTNWINSNTCGGGGGGGGITTLNTLTALTQTFATGTSGTDFTISSSSSTHTFNLPSSSASNRGLLLAADWTTFNNKQAALGFTAENIANKNATNGYAGLSSGKVAIAQLQEVIGVSDLTDFTGKSGTGTTAIGATITSPTSNQCLLFDGTKWINSSSCSGDMILSSIQTVTGAKTFNAGKLIVGTNSGAPTVVANSFYRDSSDSKLYIGNAAGSSWDEIFEAGISGPISPANGGNGLVGNGSNVSSASTISISGKIFHVTGTTNITSISTSGILSGTEITIIFDGVLTFTDGSNLKLNGNFVTSADDTITLVFDGTNFYETSRSSN
jgi:hypothetical protein